MENNMIQLQSKRGHCYEFDPDVSKVDDDEWGIYYRGICKDQDHPNDVTICELHLERKCPEYILKRLDRFLQIHLKHPNIIPITDFITLEGSEGSDWHLYMIEEELNGITMSDFLQGHICDSGGKGSKDFADLYALYQHNRSEFARKTTGEILQGVQYLHHTCLWLEAIGLKSIVVTYQGIVKIRIIHSWIDSILLRTYSQLTSQLGRGFSWFDSPEVILDHAHVDNRADIYSVGMLLFYIITGHQPYYGKSQVEVLEQQVRRNVPLNDIEDRKLRKIIKKATEKDRRKRYQTVDEFIQALMLDETQSPVWYERAFKVVSSVFRLRENICMAWVLFIIFIIFTSPSAKAQNSMRVHYTNGAKGDIPIAQIDSITFVDAEGGGEEEVQVKELTGSWLWGSAEMGYYELLTFNEDKTYTGYDKYFIYGFDTMTYGYYSVYGAMLNMWSNGFGYQHRYNWFFTALTENALGVMTKMGPFTYYKLQPGVIRLKVNETMMCPEGDSFVFADGVVVSIDDNKLSGISPGTTYVQKQSATMNRIYAYKVIVE